MATSRASYIITKIGDCARREVINEASIRFGEHREYNTLICGQNSMVAGNLTGWKTEGRA